MCNAIGTRFSQHGGPRAPHFVRFFSRSDLARELQDIRALGGTVPAIVDLDGSIPRHANDVFMVTKHYLASKSPLQIHACCSHCQRANLVLSQPRNDASLKPIPPKMAAEVRTRCANVLSQRVITQAASEFLIAWASGTLRREPRPQTYRYLDYRWRGREVQARQIRAPIAYDGEGFLV